MSQISKLGYVDNKLGAPSSGQQTTRIIFNTIEAPGTTSSLTFFKTFQGLTTGSDKPYSKSPRLNGVYGYQNYLACAI
jgi:hypothetical protein